MRYNDLMAPLAYASRQLFERVKLHARPARELAREAGLDPTVLSMALRRRRKVRVNDPRILKLGRLVGLKKDELFDFTDEKEGAA